MFRLWFRAKCEIFVSNSFIICIQQEKYIRASGFLHKKKHKQNKQYGIFETT